MTVKQPVCRYCQSDNVQIDSMSSWDIESAAWVTTAEYDNGTCQDCGEDQKYFDWLPVDQSKTDDN